MADRKTKTARPRRKRESSKAEPLFAVMSEKQLAEVLAALKPVHTQLGFVLVHLLIEQRQHRHERRMATLKQLGSAAAFLPVTLVKGATSMGRSIVGAYQRWREKAACPQE